VNDDNVSKLRRQNTITSDPHKTH